MWSFPSTNNVVLEPQPNQTVIFDNFNNNNIIKIIMCWTNTTNQKLHIYTIILWQNWCDTLFRLSYCLSNYQTYQ